MTALSAALADRYRIDRELGAGGMAVDEAVRIAREVACRSTTRTGWAWRIATQAREHHAAGRARPRGRLRHRKGAERSGRRSVHADGDECGDAGIGSSDGDRVDTQCADCARALHHLPRAAHRAGLQRSDLNDISEMQTPPLGGVGRGTGRLRQCSDARKRADQSRDHKSAHRMPQVWVRKRTEKEVATGYLLVR